MTGGCHSRDWATREQTPEVFDGEASRFVHLYGVDRLQEFLAHQARHLSHPRIRMSLDGRVIKAPQITRAAKTFRGETHRAISPDLVREYLQRGATLIVSDIEGSTVELRAFATDLAMELKGRVQINAYLSHGGASGFDIHYDPHDTFIVQLEGEKKWELFGMTVASPIHGMPSVPSDAPTTDPQVVDLVAGQVLFVPRGEWHRATADRRSLHLTVAVLSPTGVDVIKWLAAELATDPGVRASLPLADDLCATYLRSLGERVVERLHRDDAVRTIYEFEKSLRPDGEWGSALT